MRKHNQPYKLLLAFMVLAMLGSGAVLVREWYPAFVQYRLDRQLSAIAFRGEAGESGANGQQENQAQDLSDEESGQGEGYVSPIDFSALKKQNPDTVGWLSIAGAQKSGADLEYPIVQAKDNEVYLKTSFDGKKSVYGAIFLDAESQPDFRGRNNLIYGHHMKDGTMFGNLERFRKEDFFREHDRFVLYTPQRTIYLRAVACYSIRNEDQGEEIRRMQFAGQEEFDEWVRERLAPCRFAEIPEESVASVFAFVTCSYDRPDSRTILYALETDENGEIVFAGGKSVLVDEAKSVAVCRARE